MATYLIIGPSGIGKSTALKHLSEYKDVEVFDLDRLLEKEAEKGLTEYAAELGWGGFFNKSKQIIESLKSEKENIIVAVGAGSFEDIPSHQWYAAQNTISLTGDINKIYPRCGRQKYHPKIESYKLIEFSPWRMKLYNSTKFNLDVTELNSEQVATSIYKITQME